MISLTVEENGRLKFTTFPEMVDILFFIILLLRGSGNLKGGKDSCKYYTELESSDKKLMEECAFQLQFEVACRNPCEFQFLSLS